MVAIAQCSSSALPMQGTPQTTQAFVNATPDADASKAYHATGEWGKRGMTLQELTRAFDAFNEHEERMAIGFAWSEDCSRRLEEPLSEVKTVFTDLDGLRPLRPCHLSDFPSDPSFSSSSSPSSSTSTTPISSYQPSTLRHNSVMRTTDDFEYAVRPSGSKVVRGNSQFARIGGHGSISVAAVDEDTIKASHRRRRTLSAVSPPETSPVPDEGHKSNFRLEERVEGFPSRPPSRLGFFDREVEEDESDTERNSVFGPKPYRESIQIRGMFQGDTPCVG